MPVHLLFEKGDVVSRSRAGTTTTADPHSSAVRLIIFSILKA